MTLEEIENYIKVIEINPNSKYILVVSRHTGLSQSQLAQLHLNEQFLDEILLVNGRPKDVVESFPLTKN